MSDMEPTAAPLVREPVRRRLMARQILIVVGYGLLALGIVGAFVPLLPTTVFWLLAIACFLRSSPRLARRILRDRRAGPAVKDWLRHGAISRSGKIAACSGMTFGFILSGAAFGWALVPVAITATLLAGAAAFVVTRPSPVAPAARGRRP